MPRSVVVEIVLTVRAVCLGVTCYGFGWKLETDIATVRGYRGYRNAFVIRDLILLPETRFVYCKCKPSCSGVD